MKQKRLKKSLLYALVVSLIGGGITGGVMIKNSFREDESLKLVNSPILDTVIPVSLVSNGMIRPYNDSNVLVLNSFYDYKASSDSQLNSIIYYDNTYMQDTGNIYASDNKFDVLAVADGEVLKVEDSTLSGKIVTIKHENDVISIYQFLEDVTITPNKIVKQGDKIGTSGTSNIVDNTKNQLYFELLVHGSLVNAEDYYGKSINEL